MITNFKTGSQSNHPIHSNPWTDPIHVKLWNEQLVSH